MEYLQQMLAVLAVFGILGGALWWLRRRGFARFAILAAKKRSPELLSQVERLPLSATHSLHLIRMADRAILVASWPGGCQAIESSSWSQLTKSDAGDVR